MSSPKLYIDWYRRFAPVVQRRALSIVGDESEAQDIVHDVFVTAISKRAIVAGQGSVLAWLYTATTRRALNRLRDSRNRTHLLGLAAAAGADSAPRPTQETAHFARALLDSLPDELVEIAIYYWGDEMTQQEIADLLGCARRTVSHRLARVREHLSSEGWLE